MLLLFTTLFYPIFRWLKHANEAVLPFYILHQTVLVRMGFFVVRWPLHYPAKWLVISLVSLVVIVVDVRVRRAPQQPPALSVWDEAAAAQPAVQARPVLES